MFVNQSNIPRVSGPFTREISSLLMNYSGLRIYPGDYQNADAVLLGIVSSKKRRNDTLETVGTQLSSDVAPVITQNRRKFYVPRSTAINLKLHLVLIKRPTKKDLKLITSDLRKYIRTNSKIIFNETLNVRGAFTRDIHGGDAVVVNQTQNLGNQRLAIDEMAKEVADNFKEVVLYAF